jgi:hypothetical protein
MEKQKLKHQVPRWLGSAAAAVALLAVPSANAQTNDTLIAYSGYTGVSQTLNGLLLNSTTIIEQQWNLNLGTQIATGVETITTPGYGSLTFTASNNGSYVAGTTGNGSVFSVGGGNSPYSFGFQIVDTTAQLPAGYTLDSSLGTFGTLVDVFNNTGGYPGQSYMDISDAIEIPFSAPSFTIQSTPEPTTLALAGLGGLSLLFFRRRK